MAATVTEEMAAQSTPAALAALAGSAGLRRPAVPHQLTPIPPEDSPDTAPQVEMVMAALAEPAVGVTLLAIKEAAAVSAPDQESAAAKAIREQFALFAATLRPCRAVAVAVTEAAAQVSVLILLMAEAVAVEALGLPVAVSASPQTPAL